MPHADEHIRGFVFDLETGALREVPAATAQAATARPDQ